jgi:hypothetical protein
MHACFSTQTQQMLSHFDLHLMLCACEKVFPLLRHLHFHSVEEKEKAKESEMR